MNPMKLSINGEPYYHSVKAAEIVECVSQNTIWNWAKKGVTSFGFDLDTVTHKGHLFIPASKVTVLKQLLDDHPIPHAGRIPERTLADLKLAIRAHNKHSHDPSP